MLKFYCTLLLGCTVFLSFAQKIHFSGSVYDINTKSPLANVQVKYLGGLTYTNEKGEFQLEFEKDIVEITFNLYSYQTLRTLFKNSHQDIFLSKDLINLSDVSITGQKRNNKIDNYELLSQQDLKKKPGFLANPDLLNEIKTKAGVTNGGEGNAGLYVRGGSSGQNLVLFNHSTIYNPSHLLGFFSVFKTSSVKEAKVYKSGIPPEYNSRLSSVIDVSSDRDLEDSLSAEASLSILSAEISVSAPLSSKWSFNTAVRKTFMNYSVWPIVNSLSKGHSSFNNLGYDFYDVNLSSIYQPNEKNKIFIAGYAGGDKFGFEIGRFGIENSIDWKNQAASIEWTSKLSGNAQLTSVASYSGYNFNFGLAQESTVAKIHSEIKDYDLKSIYLAYIKKHKIKIGLSYTSHDIIPNTPNVTSGRVELDFGSSNKYNVGESALFVSDRIDVQENISIEAGLRFSHYNQTSSVIIGMDAQKGAEGYSKFSLEPSANLAYALDSKTSLKLSFSRNVQNLHLLPVAASNFPVDFWMPSTSKLSPERGIQLSLGIFKNWSKSDEFYLDIYYKKMNNIIEFNGGISNLLDNLQIEDNVFSGSGKIIGAEVFIQKTIGKLNGSLGYTLSKNRRKFPQINNGEAFPFKYDRTHELNISGNYQLSKAWKLGGYFTYSTGSAYTAPISRYIVSGSIINEYGPFNGSRMLAYHRLDFAATYSLNKTRHFRSELSFSVYNIYSRKNPIFDYFQFEGDLKSSVSTQQKSIALLPILPAFSYKIYFRR